MPLYRREGMTSAEFRNYYDHVHARIGEKVLGPYATYYARHFLTPIGEPPPGAPDVITEVVYRDRAAFDACIANLSDPQILAEVIADEEKLFDRTRICLFTVETDESDLSAYDAGRGAAA